MKIFDCFMYFDEELVLDVRLNTLNEYVDYFVIIESKFTHKGDKRDLKFDHNKFLNFKDKIIYKVYDEIPGGLKKINQNDPVCYQRLRSNLLISQGFSPHLGRSFFCKT